MTRNYPVKVPARYRLCISTHFAINQVCDQYIFYLHKDKTPTLNQPLFPIRTTCEDRNKVKNVKYSLKLCLGYWTWNAVGMQ